MDAIVVRPTISFGSSDRDERAVFSAWQAHDDDVAWADGAAAQDDAHDARLRKVGPVGAAAADVCLQTLLKAVDLEARRAKSGHFDDCLGTDVKLGAGR